MESDRLPDSPVDPAVFLITGPIAAGKSTVGSLLARRFERGVYLEGNFFRRSIARGRAEMTPNAAPEAVEQLRLRYRLAAATADTYAEAGFTVALEDVVAGPLLGEYRTMIRHRPCHVVVLAPSLDTIAAREASRGAKGYAEWPIRELYEGFLNTTPRVGVWLDSSEMSPDQTVDEILARTASERDRIVIADPDPGWPMLFERIAAPVRQAFADLPADVQHIGSTSVPGLAAKPVIDVDVVVAAPSDVPAAIERLRGLGYVYQGDKGIPGREAFLWPPGSPRHHLYVVVAGNKPHTDHIRFRDLLRGRPDLAQQYAALKRTLAEAHEKDRVGYTDAKDDFITEALAEARQVQAGDDPREFTASDVEEVLRRLEDGGLRYWIDGGWGIDALLEVQTRRHDDLDLVIDQADLSRAAETLADLGFKHAPQVEPGLPARMVLVDKTDRQVDLHPVIFDLAGNGWQPLDGEGWAQYPADGLTGSGKIGQKPVACLTPPLQLRHHLGYRWKSDDQHDMAHLAERFGLALPPSDKALAPGAASRSEEHPASSRLSDSDRAR